MPCSVFVSSLQRRIDSNMHCWILLCSLFVVTNGESFNISDKFLSDVKGHFKCDNSIIVMEEADVFFRNVTLSGFTTYLDYSNQEEMELVADYIQWLKDNGLLEIIFFVGSHSDKLLVMLESKMNLFHSGVVGIISGHNPPNMTFQLNTKLFQYEHTTDGIVVSEYYAIKKGTTIKREIGIWNVNSGILIDRPHIWERRSNLMGLRLRAAAMAMPIFTNIKYDERGSIAEHTGVFPDMLKVIEGMMNFSSQISVPKDGKWGTIEADGRTWNGLVGMLVNDETDIVPASLMFTLEREVVVDFSVSLYHHEKTLIVAKQKGRSIRAWTYSGIFTSHAWCVWAVMIATISVWLFIINYSGQNKFHGSLNSEKFTILSSFALTLLLYLQLSYEVLVKSNSAKVIYFVSCIEAYLLFGYYISDLKSSATAGYVDLPITSFRGIIDRNYKVIVQDGTASVDILKAADPKSDMYKVYSARMDQDSFVGSNEDAIQALLSEDKGLDLQV
jgi:ABC-type amino acid transport substrate-binding protein